MARHQLSPQLCSFWACKLAYDCLAHCSNASMVCCNFKQSASQLDIIMSLRRLPVDSGIKHIPLCQMDQYLYSWALERHAISLPLHACMHVDAEV